MNPEELKQEILTQVGRLLTDPLWYFYQSWFAKYLSAERGLSQQELSITWVVFLAADIGETNDLMAQQPERAKELQAVWDKWNTGNAPPRWGGGGGQGKGKAKAKNKNKQGKDG